MKKHISTLIHKKTKEDAKKSGWLKKVTNIMRPWSYTTLNNHVRTAGAVGKVSSHYSGTHRQSVWQLWFLPHNYSSCTVYPLFNYMNLSSVIKYDLKNIICTKLPDFLLHFQPLCCIPKYLLVGDPLLIRFYMAPLTSWYYMWEEKVLTYVLEGQRIEGNCKRRGW